MAISKEFVGIGEILINTPKTRCTFKQWMVALDLLRVTLVHYIKTCSFKLMSCGFCIVTLVSKVDEIVVVIFTSFGVF
jgi:hypothetical protein